MIRRTKRMAQGTDILGILAILAFSLATKPRWEKRLCALRKF
jgi:hypothetical protein